MVVLQQFWSYNHSFGAGFTAALLGSEVPGHKPGGFHPTRSCRASWTKATSPDGVWGSPNMGVTAAFDLSQLPGLTCTELHPQRCPCPGRRVMGHLGY